MSTDKSKLSQTQIFQKSYNETLEAIKVVNADPSSGGATEVTAQAILTKVTSIDNKTPASPATSGKQDTGNTSLASIDTKTPALVTGRVPVDGSGVVQPVSQSGTWSVAQSGAWTVAATQSGTWNITNISGTISLPAGASTEATLSTLNGKVPTGLTVSATRLLVDASGTTQPVSGTVAATQSGTWNINNIAGTVSLPTGAATETTLAGIRTRQDVVSFGAGTTAQRVAAVIGSSAGENGNANPVYVTPSSGSTFTTNFSQLNGVGPISSGFGAPGGQTLRVAAQLGIGSSSVSITNAVPTYLTDGTSSLLSTNNGTTDASTLRVAANITRNGTALSYNTGASDANTLRVALANESRGSQGTAPVQLTSAGFIPYFQDFSSTSISAAYTQVVASTGVQINRLMINNNSGAVIYIAIGAAAAEVPQLVALPGAEVTFPIQIATGTRITISTPSGTITSGQIAINAFN